MKRNNRKTSYRKSWQLKNCSTVILDKTFDCEGGAKVTTLINIHSP